MNLSFSERSLKTRGLMARLVCLTVFFCVSAGAAFAQSVTVRGKVSDESGAPMPGVSIYIKDTTTGVVSDLDGNYSITAGESAVLVYNSLGYLVEEVAVKGRKEINVVLREDRTSLDEVVVVGYGTQKKAHLTGSVAAVSQTELLKTTSSNVSQALVGKLPGIVS